MKWFLLLLIIACGHHEPPPQDVGDSDGDQIPNYLEAGDDLQKYTAKIVPFAEVKATLSFRKDVTPVSLDLSNESDLTKSSFKLLTKRPALLHLEDHFSEFTKLRITSTVTADLPEKAYEITLRFLPGKDMPERLFFGDTFIGEVQSVMKFYLSASDLKSLIEGKTSLTMARKKDVPFSVTSTVRERTYRVFWNDGHSTEVFYVSKELPFNKFLSLKKISQSRPVDELDGLGWTDEHEDWWIREIGENDKVIVKASEVAIAKAREDNFTKSTQVVQRINGTSVKTLSISKAPEAKLILKIRGNRELRTFAEEITKYTRGGGQAGPMDCYNYERNIVSQGDKTLLTPDILQSMVLVTESKTFNTTDLISFARESFDVNGPYLEIHINSPEQNFQMSLPNRPQSTFTRTGIYQWYCDAIPMRYEGVVTNEEGHFILNIESFIEKID